MHSRWRIPWLALLSLLALQPARAAELPRARPEQAGMSSAKLQRVNEVMRGFVKDKKLAGGIVMIARGGKIVFFQAYGKRDREADKPMRKDTLLRIYSMSKAITSAAVMILVDEGKVKLDAAVSEYLPEFKDLTVWRDGKQLPARRAMTVRDLLRHTSGLSYGGGSSEPARRFREANVLDMSQDLAAMTKKLGKLPLHFDPGSKWLYGVSTDVLGRVVEVASKQPLEKFLQQRLFDPLDMKDTGFHVPANKLDRFAANYNADGKGRLTVRDAPATSEFAKPRALKSGGGGLVSTTRDYMRFLMMIARGGQLQGKRILSRKAVRAMTTNQMPPGVKWVQFGAQVREGVGFGLGFSVRTRKSDWDPAGRVGEYGWGGAASTHYWVSPRDDLIVITMEQSWPFSFKTEWALKGLIYDAIEAPLIRGRRVTAEPSAKVEQQLDLVYAQYGDRKLKLDLFQAREDAEPDASAKKRPAVVVVHGGGWLKGDKSKFRGLAQALAERGYVTAAIEYRLGGEARFPAAIHDCNAAVRWLRAHAAKYRIDPQRIGAVGGSAGGHLVGLMAAAPNQAQLQGNGGHADQSSRLQAAIVMAGPLDLAVGPVAEKSRKQPEKSNSNKWLGKTVDQAPDLYRLASPTSHFRSTTPPMLFQTGELDQPVRNRRARQLLAKRGVTTGIQVYTAGKHGCWNQHPWFEVMLDDMDTFLSAHLGKQPNRRRWELRRTERGRIELSDSEVLVTTKAASGSGINMPPFHNPICRVYLRDDPQRASLKLIPGVKDWRIQLPKSIAAGAEVQVVVETLGRPRRTSVPPIVSGTAAGVQLPAHLAHVHGRMLRYEPQPHKNTVGYWIHEQDWCGWRFYIDRPGRYAVHIHQGCGKGQGGSVVAVRIGEQRLEFKVEDTGHFQNFKERHIGEVQFSAPGRYNLELRPQKKAAQAVMDVRRITLKPLGDGSRERDGDG